MISNHSSLPPQRKDVAAVLCAVDQIPRTAMQIGERCRPPMGWRQVLLVLERLGTNAVEMSYGRAVGDGARSVTLWRRRV